MIYILQTEHLIEKTLYKELHFPQHDLYELFVYLKAVLYQHNIQKKQTMFEITIENRCHSYRYIAIHRHYFPSCSSHFILWMSLTTSIQDYHQNEILNIKLNWINLLSKQCGLVYIRLVIFFHWCFFYFYMILQCSTIFGCACEI